MRVYGARWTEMERTARFPKSSVIEDHSLFPMFPTEERAM